MRQYYRDVRFAENKDIAIVGNNIESVREFVNRITKAAMSAGGYYADCEMKFERGDYATASKKAAEGAKLLWQIEDYIHKSVGTFGKGNRLPEQLDYLSK